MISRQNNDCSVGCHRFLPVREQKKKQSFSELLYGSPNWARTSDIMINSHSSHGEQTVNELACGKHAENVSLQCLFEGIPTQTLDTAKSGMHDVKKQQTQVQSKFGGTLSSSEKDCFFFYSPNE